MHPKSAPSSNAMKLGNPFGKTLAKPLADWLETRFVAPAYGGGLLLVLAIFFFIAATNTLSGWLYAMSGTLAALLLLAAWLSRATLRGLQISRGRIAPVTAGEPLWVEFQVSNSTTRPKGMVQVQDWIPPALGQPQLQVLETLAGQASSSLTYALPTTQRGIYRWQAVNLRTAAPLGLFWTRRSHRERAIAMVYPPVLPLNHCPLLDEIGQDASLSVLHNRQAQAANEGMTRSLRPYLWGDPTRMIHWRTSARYGELRVRELEVITSGQDVVICLDSAARWPSDDFEAAVIAAATLYFYADQRNLQVSLWTAGTGIVRGHERVLEALAGTQPGELVNAASLPEGAMVWLTQNLASLETLPPQSRWVLWQPQPTLFQAPPVQPGLVMQPGEPLPGQLQRPIVR
jgi:uncharacterized protein (DUF58 family)